MPKKFSGGEATPSCTPEAKDVSSERTSSSISFANRRTAQPMDFGTTGQRKNGLRIRTSRETFDPATSTTDFSDNKRGAINEAAKRKRVLSNPSLARAVRQNCSSVFGSGDARDLSWIAEWKRTPCRHVAAVLDAKEIRGRTTEQLGEIADYNRVP